MKSVDVSDFFVFTNSVADAWGKVPSGFLDGNHYTLGAFSECFHIERNAAPYKSKYCLGEMNLNGIWAPKSNQHVDDEFLSLDELTDNELLVTPSMALAR